MAKLHMHSPSVLWLLLIAMTIGSLVIFERHMQPAIAGTAIVMIAAAKSRIVILHYMEAKRVSATWRRMYLTWNFACAALIIIGNLTTLQHQ